MKYYHYLTLIILVLVTAGCPDSTVETDNPIATNPQKFDITWTQLTNMPNPQGWGGLNACILNNKIYVVGGFSDQAIVGDVSVYDPATDTWERKSPLNTARWGHTSNVVNGKIYVMGGCSGASGKALKSIEVYDPEKDLWELSGEMALGRIGAGSAVVDGKIYMVAGCDAEPPEQAFNNVDCYDTDNKEWQICEVLPVATSYLSATALNGKIYAFGGTDGLNNDGLPSIFEYDISKNNWIQKTDLKTERWGHSTCGNGELIFCIGGVSDGTSAALKKVEVYSPSKDSVYKATDMVFQRMVLATCAYNDRIYTFGGALNYPSYLRIAVTEVGELNK